MINNERIVIVGFGELAKELISWMIESRLFIKIEERLFFIDDKENKNFCINNIKVTCLGKISEFFPAKEDKLYLGIADPKIKFKIVNELIKRKANFQSFIHPSVILSPSAEYGKGCIIFPYSVCSYNSKLNDFITVNTHSAIGHDVFIDSFCTISSFVDLTGNVHLGKRVLVGSGARFLPKVKIGKDSLVGLGAIIYKSLPSGKTAYANPSKII